MKRYTLMFYHAVLFLGLNEIGPVNNNELMFATAALLACAMLEALLFSDMASVLTSLQSEVNEVQQ
jgi:hypothetical protein